MEIIKTYPQKNSRLEIKKCTTDKEKLEALNFSPAFKEWVKEDEIEDWSCYIMEEIPCFMGDDVTYFISTKHELLITSFDDCPRTKSIASIEIKDMDEYILTILN